jgi:recombinational DNA repair protein RecR
MLGKVFQMIESKEQIYDFVKRKRDSCALEEREYYAAIYFVLRNRTEDNWGPKELTIDIAMGGDFP